MHISWYDIQTSDIQKGYVHFYSHAAAEFGACFLKNLYKALENEDIAWSWSNKVEIFILNHYDYVFCSEEQWVFSAVFHLAFWCSFSEGEEHVSNPFQWDFVGKNLVAMAVQGVAFFILNLLMQHRLFSTRWYVWKLVLIFLY